MYNDNHMQDNKIAIHPADPGLHAQAETLAAQLKLPLTQNDEDAYDYLLVLTPDYLGLQKTAAKSSPLVVDFFAKDLQYRCKQLSIKKEALARALGLKKNTQPTIIDATGGLARDSFILASLGFEVEMLERSPIIHALIADGMQRAQNQPAIQRMQLRHADAITWLNTAKPDIVYLDPMFPERKKSALPKQEMLIFHDIAGDDADAEALLARALACATRRVVVKRPRLATTLIATCPPSFSLTGKSCRFDVYIL